MASRNNDWLRQYKKKINPGLLCDIFLTSPVVIHNSQQSSYRTYTHTHTSQEELIFHSEYWYDIHIPLSDNRAIPAASTAAAQQKYCPATAVLLNNRKSRGAKAANRTFICRRNEEGGTKPDKVGDDD